MAIITGSLPQLHPTGSRTTAVADVFYMPGQIETVINARTVVSTVISQSGQTGGVTLTPIYRSFVGGEYVYTNGSPADGFVFTSIVGFKEE